MSIERFIEGQGKAHHHRPEIRCTRCHAKLNCDAGISDVEPPKPGDVAVCAYCGEVYQFGPGLTVAPCPQSELDQMQQEDPKNYAVLMGVKQRVALEAGKRRRSRGVLN